MAMPQQKPGRSKQDYQTPADLMAAVVKRFGFLQCDLAATEETARCSRFISPEQDSLKTAWDISTGRYQWLNPPFADIAPWAEKCMKEAERGAWILLLTPASVGSEWFRKYIHRNALVLALNPRLTFVGETTPYPKDCMISVFCERMTGFDVWRWK